MFECVLFPLPTYIVILFQQKCLYIYFVQHVSILLIGWARFERSPETNIFEFINCYGGCRGRNKHIYLATYFDSFDAFPASDELFRPLLQILKFF